MTHPYSAPVGAGVEVQNEGGDLLLNGGRAPGDPAPLPRSRYPVLRGVLELANHVYQLSRFRREVEEAILQVPEDFKLRFRRTTLRLRAWPRRKGDPPYALYWITFPPRKNYCEDWLAQVIERLPGRRCWFHRLKIRNSRDLDRAIHRAGLDYARRDVHAFHRRARALNEAHKTLTGALDSVRKILRGKAASDPAATERPPVDPLLLLPRDATVVYSGLLMLDDAIRRHQADAELLVRWARRRPRWQPFRLTFPVDFDHPNGRFLWIDDESGRSFGRLNYRDRKALGLSNRASRFISPIEMQRRLLDRRLKASTSIIRRIRPRIPAAMARAQALLAEARAVPRPQPDANYIPHDLHETEGSWS